MRKPSATQRMFQDRFIAVAEKHVSMGQYEKGFLTDVAKSLDVRTSVVQAWLKRSVPSGNHLVTICEKWHISPNYLLGTEEALEKPIQNQTKKEEE
jgi:DNA polymerase III psi subunit